MALRKFQMILPRHQILFPEKKDGNMLWGLDPWPLLDLSGSLKCLKYFLNNIENKNNETQERNPEKNTENHSKIMES